IDKIRCHVAGDMQQRRTAIPRLNNRSRSIAGTGTRTRQRHPELSRNSRVCIRHIDCGAFVAGRYNAESTMTLERGIKGNVLEADDSENGIDANSLQLL